MMTSAPDPANPPAGIHLSALAGYGGLPGAVQGVGFWPRALARLIDMAVHFAASFFAGILFVILLVIAAGGHVSPLVMAKLQPLTFVSFVLALLGSVAYHAICEGISGRSLGKAVLSMVVVQEDGGPCRLGSALIRSLAYLVDALFFGAVGYFAMQRTPQEQRYGDEWAHTIVCKRSEAPAGSLRSGGRFAVAFMCAVLVDIALAMVGLLAKIT
jgi:uncharacterized RDD family membrane protein YckC